MADGRIHGEREKISRPIHVERVPRGRCAAPIPPAPDVGRAASIKSKQLSKSRANRESRIIILPQDRSPPTKPKSKWKVAYGDFKRKVSPDEPIHRVRS